MLGYIRLHAGGFIGLSNRNHMGIRSIAVKMFIIYFLPDQLFGVGALAHRGLPPFVGGLCGDHSPHRTTMTQTKRCPIFKFGSWWAHPQEFERKRCNCFSE